MPQESKSGERLAETIRTAFASAQYPGDHRLVYDTSGYHMECNKVASAFKGKHWSRIADYIYWKAVPVTQTGFLYFGVATTDLG